MECPKLVECTCGRVPLNINEWVGKEARQVWHVECICGYAAPFADRPKDSCVGWNAMLGKIRSHGAAAKALEVCAIGMSQVADNNEWWQSLEDGERAATLRLWAQNAVDALAGRPNPQIAGFIIGAPPRCNHVIGGWCTKCGFCKTPPQGQFE